MTERALELVRNARDTLGIKEAQLHDGLADRDAAIVEARDAGASAIQIAEAAGLTRQQIHRILTQQQALTYAWAMDG